MLPTADIQRARFRMLINWMCFFIILGIYVSILDSPGIYSSGHVYFSNALVIVFSLYNLLADENRSFSSKKMFYLFIFFFMGIAPVLQYKNGDQTVGGYIISETTYILTNYIIFFVLLCFNFFYSVFYKRMKFDQDSMLFKDYGNAGKERKIIKLCFLSVSIASLLCTVWFNRNNLILMVFRGVDGLVLEGLPDSGNYLYTLTNTFVRPLAAVSCINYMCIGKSRRLKAILLAIMLVTCFPLSLSRLRVAAYYLPIFILWFPFVQYKNRFVLLFSFGLLVMFPLLDIFRTWSGDISLHLDFSMFRTMHFDSYQSLAFVIQNDIITNGRQLMLALFWMVPRTLWPSKPLMSGKMVADEYGLWFDQISMNYFGEGYLNFGYLGIFLFAVILAYISACFDKAFWHYGKASLKSFCAPFYLFFIGIYFFFMRGDLMFGLQYTSMLLLANGSFYCLIRQYYKK